MYKLYWHPNASSLAPMAVLEEIGVPFELHQLDYDGGETHTEGYLRLQPLGLIPALEFTAGGSMFESAAIVQYLCDRHPESALAPLPDEAGRPQYLQWLFFMADTIYPSYNRYYWSRRYTSAETGAEGIREQAAQTVLRQWQVVEDSLQRSGPWLLGKRFSACDIYLQMMTTWHETPVDLFASFPGLKNLALGVVKRERCKRAIERHSFDTGLDDK